MTGYPLSALRTLALHAQGLTRPNQSDHPPTPAELYDQVRQLGCLQIDTLQMVARSQYLVPWSRLGVYEPRDLEALQFGPGRQLFEGWQHAASIIPLEEYRFQMPHQRRLREAPGSWYERWIAEEDHPQVLAHVRERLQREGPLRVSDFASDGVRGGTWWNWRPAKVALEYLFAWGELMIADRVHFQRIYDLTERLLPGWVDREEPSAQQRDRFWVERGARALGAFQARQAGDYTWMKVSRSRPIVLELVQEGLLVAVQAHERGGQASEWLVHRDLLPLLEQAADGALPALRTTFLSPFDSLFWAAGRDQKLWGFRKALEAYLPAEKRVYGYFSLPILHRERLVGRFDPKLERKTGLLRIKALHLEAGVRPEEQLVQEVAGAMRSFLAFHHATDLQIERSDPPAFGRKLARQM